MPVNRLLRAAFAALAVTAVASARPAAAQTVMKLANATINDVQHEWQKLFAADLQKRIGDKVKTEIYPASQLGAIPRMVDGVLLGTIESFITRHHSWYRPIRAFRSTTCPACLSHPSMSMPSSTIRPIGIAWRRCSSTAVSA